MVATRSVVWPTSMAQLVAAGFSRRASRYDLKVLNRNQPPASSSRLSGGVTGSGIDRGIGASDTPQLPPMTVVTP